MADRLLEVSLSGTAWYDEIAGPHVLEIQERNRTRISTRRAEKIALVTGISRAAGIGYAIARRLVDDGFLVVGTGLRSYDDSMAWGSDTELPPLVRDRTIDYLEADFSTDTARTRVMDRIAEEYGSVTSLFLNHACSHEEGILDLTPEALDRSWRINVESSLLLLRDCARLGGLESVVLVTTSGQSVAPMPDEIPYALTRGQSSPSCPRSRQHWPKWERPSTASIQGPLTPGGLPAISTTLSDHDFPRAGGVTLPMLPISSLGS